MVCLATSTRSGSGDKDLRDSQRRFESHILRTSEPILERYRFVGRGSSRMMRRVDAAYVAELRVIVQLFIWERTQLLDPLRIGLPSPRDMMDQLIKRMRESTQDYVPSEEVAPIVGAMFLWWHEHCARHAPEHLDADVLVRGDVAELLVDELAQLVWSLRRLGNSIEVE